MCNNEDCWIRVDWEPPPRDTWMSCLLGYMVGFIDDEGEHTWINDEGTHRDLRSDRLFFFEEAEGTNHSLTIRNLKFDTRYEVVVEVFNPYGEFGPSFTSVHTPQGTITVENKHFYSNLNYNPTEPCRGASVPNPDKFVESSANSLSVHLDGWQDANCQTKSFTVEQRL